MLGGKSLGIIFFCAAPIFAATSAQATTLIVVNDTDDYVTVTVDGAYGCNTAGHTKCTIPVSPGRHALRAQKADGHITSTTGDIPPDGSVWTISPVADACSQRARASEAQIAAWNQRCVGVGSRRNPSLYRQCAQEKRELDAAQQQILNECPH